MNKSIVLAQDKFEFLGGTTTLLVDMASALLRIGGYDIYYWSEDLGTGSMTERWLESNGIQKYDGRKVDMAITCQSAATAHFAGRCKVLQLLNSKYTTLEYPVNGCKAYIAVSVEIADFMKEKFGMEVPVMLNGIDLERFKPDDSKSETVRVLSICQGDDTLLKEACEELGYKFNSVPKEVKDRVWNVEDLIKDSDIVVGIGRSAYVGMACGKCVVSWDNRSLNPNTGCGYIIPEKFFEYAHSNFTGRGYEPLDTKEKLKAELKKYNPVDGLKLRVIAEHHLNADLNTRICLALLEGNTGTNS